MSNLEIILNPRKALKRKDFITLGETIVREAKRKDNKVGGLLDGFTIKITDDMKGGENSMSFPFRIVDEK